MANFSTNQVKQFYVAKALANTLGTTKGNARFVNVDGSIYFEHVGEAGIVKSDAIPISNIVSAKAIKSYTENLNAAYVACGAAVAGQQYILRANVRQFVGMSDEETFSVIADYKAKSGDAAKNILANLAIAFAKNVSKQVWPLFKVYVTTIASGSSKTLNTDTWEVTPSSSASTLASNALIGLIIEAAPQDYRRGILAQENVYFDITANKIISSGEETAWATVTKNAANDHIASALTNSKKIADLEYFCMGERGDIYRGVGFPNNIDTKYMVDADQTYGYHLIEIAYYYQGAGEDVQKSLKELVIAVPAEGLTTYTVINALIGASSSPANGTLNKAAGKTLIAQLS